MKLPAQKTMTTRTPTSASQRSRCRSPGGATDGWRAGQFDARRSGGRLVRGDDRVDPDQPFLVELEDLLVVLLGDLEPDEQSGQDRERDHDECGRG